MKMKNESRHYVRWKVTSFWQWCRNTTNATDAARKTNSLQKRFCFTAAIYRASHAGGFLPKILGETLEAILSMFGDRIGKLLFENRLSSKIFAIISLHRIPDIDAETYQKNARHELSGGAADKRQISFPEVLRQQNQF